MAIIEHEGALTYSDANGNENVIYPVTKVGLVGGLGEAFTEFMKNIYPVGSIYMSANPADPTDLFGGTWERITDTFLLAAGQTYEAGATGGEAEHTLTIEEMPEHNHPIHMESATLGAGNAYSRVTNTGTTYSAPVTNAGGGQPHNNMPPYLAVYVWKRIA